MASAADLRLREIKDLNAQLNTTIQNQNLLITSLQKDKEEDRKLISELTEQISVLNEQLDYLKKKLFGTSSEKSDSIPGQLNIFNEAEQEQDESGEPEFPEDMLTPEEDQKPRKPKRTHAETFKGIPVKKEVIPLSDDEKQCPNCGTDLVKVGEEFVRNEFRFTPAKGELVKIYRETWKCPACTDEAATDGVDYFFKNAEVPPPLLPGSYTSESVVAWIMFQKFVEAVPLYRQETTWKQLGVPLLRATMASWMIRCAQQYLKPLYDYLHRCLLKRTFLMADETRIQVLKEPGRAAETDSFMWLFRSGEDGLAPIILFHYTQTRKKANAVEFLKGSSGYLMCDGYQGYNNLPNLKRCICYSHIRRYFVDAVPKGKELDLSKAAVQGVYYCNKLFEIERRCNNRNFTPDQRKAYREDKARPLIESFKEWLRTAKPVKGSRLDKAVTYALNQEAYLMTYLEDGRCSLHNNLSENEIHPFTTGRKNWLFSDTPKGAESSSIIYSIVECAKANDLNIYQYLVHLLERRPSFEMTDEELESLAPWNEQIKINFAMNLE